jgi:hypothetical protein
VAPSVRATMRACHSVNAPAEMSTARIGAQNWRSAASRTPRKATYASRVAEQGRRVQETAAR